MITTVIGLSDTKKSDVYLFSAEVSRYLAPFRGLPFDNRITEIVGLKPVLGSDNDLIELFCLGCALQFCLAFAFVHPEDGIVGV